MLIYCKNFFLKTPQIIGKCLLKVTKIIKGHLKNNIELLKPIERVPNKLSVKFNTYQTIKRFNTYLPVSAATNSGVRRL